MTGLINNNEKKWVDRLITHRPTVNLLFALIYPLSTTPYPLFSHLNRQGQGADRIVAELDDPGGAMRTQFLRRDHIYDQIE
jgi:hypothetical protein